MTNPLNGLKKYLISLFQITCVIKHKKIQLLHNNLSPKTFVLEREGKNQRHITTTL